MLAFLVLWLTGCQRAPQDAAIEKHFSQHKAEFEELVLLISSAFQDVGRLYSFDGYSDYLDSQPRYVALMDAVAASRSPITYSEEAERHVVKPDPKAISFELGEAGFLNSAGLFGDSKGVVFFPAKPSFDDTHRLVSNTNKAKVIETDDLRFYKHIEDGWYVYRHIED